MSTGNTLLLYLLHSSQQSGSAIHLTSSTPSALYLSNALSLFILESSVLTNLLALKNEVLKSFLISLLKEPQLRPVVIVSTKPLLSFSTNCLLSFQIRSLKFLPSPGTTVFIALVTLASSIGIFTWPSI